MIVVADGVITEVKENADVEAMKKKDEEINNLKNEVETLKNSLAASETVKAETEVKIQNALNEFQNFKAKLISGDIEFEQDFKGADKKDSIVAATLEYRKKQVKK